MGNMDCVRGTSAGESKEQKYLEMVDLSRQNYMAGGQERKRLHRATRNGAWISDIPLCLKGM